MSFEGHYQILCKNGHLWVPDVYEEDYGEEFKCATCGEPEAWRNLVDQTNGSWDEFGERIDGWVNLKVKTPGKTCKCKECGHEHQVEEPTFVIPEKKAKPSE